MNEQLLDQHLIDVQREYLDFLDDEEDQGTYFEAIKQMISENRKRLRVNINDLRRKYPARATGLLENSFEELGCLQKALREIVVRIDTNFAKQYDDFYVAFEGSFGNRHVTPRTLNSNLLGNLTCVEGIVTKCSLIRPKVVKSVHYCPTTKKVTERKYTDLTSIDAFPSSAVYPTKDEDGNLLETEYGLSVYKDHQTITIQEMPEKAPAGQLPRSIDVVCDDDLVDLCKPGDRVQIVGSYRCLPGKQNAYTSGTFRTIIIANNVSVLSKESARTLVRDDITQCKMLARNKNVIKILCRSLAPSIHGNEYVKKAILCLLVGGVEKNLINGTRLRGDINVLLIGDPSVAKSQLLRYVLYTAPRAIPTTGRGATGVGLTAAVTSDPETGERRLEAGAMVLGDRGIVCIDEFDKMSDIDRTAIHEVMEQGRVTISKAGVHATLNARCSVLAAANPVYGRYDQYKTPMENIGLQDSLLSRFDLLFVMLDTVDPNNDNIIADHVLRMHRYRKPGEQDGEVLQMGQAVEMLSTNDPNEEDEDEQQSIYEKYNPLLHGKTRSRTEKYLTPAFMRKYINVAKMMKPKLSQEAVELISNEFSTLRCEENIDRDVARTQPVTARTLETLIRLSTAHAKARLSAIVEEKDALAAIELIQFAYFKKVLEKEKPRKRRRESRDGAESHSDDEDVATDENRPQPKRVRTVDDTADVTMETTTTDPNDLTTRVTRSHEEPSTSAGMDVSEPAIEISNARLGAFRASLQKYFEEERKDMVPLAEAKARINREHATEPFSESEVRSALHLMTDANQIMVADDFIILI